MQLSTPMLNQIASGSFILNWFVSVQARDRITNNIENMHLWNGDSDFTTKIGGINTTFIGSGNLLEMPRFSFTQGVDVKTHAMSLNVLSPEIINIIRAYDSRYAPITFYVGIFNPANFNLVGIVKVYSGFIDTIEISEVEDSETCTIDIVSGIRSGTKPLTLMKSHESQKLRDETDEGFKYSTIAESVLIEWQRDDGGYKVPFSRPSVTRPRSGNSDR